MSPMHAGGSLHSNALVLCRCVSVSLELQLRATIESQPVSSLTLLSRIASIFCPGLGSAKRTKRFLCRLRAAGLGPLVRGLVSSSRAPLAAYPFGFSSSIYLYKSPMKSLPLPPPPVKTKKYWNCWPLRPLLWMLSSALRIASFGWMSAYHFCTLAICWAVGSRHGFWHDMSR